LMLKQGILTSDFREFTDIHEIEDIELSFPLIVKPVDSNSSKGVRQVTDTNELILHVKNALELSRSGKAIVEEYVQGTEIGIDCIVNEGIAEILMVKERRKIAGIEDQQIFGCIWPIDLGALTQLKYKNLAQSIADALGLHSSPLMIQAIENANGISVIEFAARIGGGESFRLIKKSVQVDVIDLAIDTFLGQPLNFKIKEPYEYFAETFIYADACCFDKIEGFDILLDDGTLEYIDSNKEQGSIIGGGLTSNNRVGVFAVKGDNRQVLNDKIQRVLGCIQVSDCLGVNKIRDGIYKELISAGG